MALKFLEEIIVGMAVPGGSIQAMYKYQGTTSKYLLLH